MSGMKAVDTMPSVMLLYARLYFESVKFNILTVLATEKKLHIKAAILQFFE